MPAWLANLLLALLATALALWLADLAFRAYERSQLLPRLPDAEGQGPVNLGALRYNEGLVARQADEGEFRILSFGDSFAYSVLEPPYSYNGVLQRALNESGAGGTIRVVNLGEPATGTRQYRVAYDYWSRVLEHQGVLFMIFIGNDLLDDAYLHAALEWAPNEAVIRGDNPILEPGQRRIPHKFPLRMFDYAYAWLMSERTRSEQGLPEGYNWAGLMDFDEQTFLRINARYLENFDPKQLPDLLPGYEQVLRLLQRAAQISAQGKRVAIAIGPSEAQVDDELRTAVLESQGRSADEFDLGLPQRIIRRLREQHAPEVPLIDLTDAFRAQAQHDRERLFFRRNTHWDMAGNRLAGEVLAARLLEAWFGQPAATPPAPEFKPLPDNALLDVQAIDEYLRPLFGPQSAGGTRISGAVRAIHLMDGVADRNDNWAIAPLLRPVLIEFNQPVQASALRLHLYDADGRRYRYRLEARSDGQWRTIADQSAEPVSGVQEIALNGQAIAALRLTGLSSSLAGEAPSKGYIHIKELELLP
jgi:hypothetical protein